MDKQYSKVSNQEFELTALPENIQIDLEDNNNPTLLLKQPAEDIWVESTFIIERVITAPERI